MAFKLSSSNADESWKSQAFINISVPGVNGNPKRLGSIPLKESKPAERQLIEHLKAHPEYLKELFAHATFDFQLADDVENNGFALNLLAQ